MKGAIYMVPRPNLGGNFISFLHPGPLDQDALPSRYAHCGDSTRDREFDSNVSYFFILIKVCSIFVYTNFTWFFCSFHPGWW